MLSKAFKSPLVRVPLRYGAIGGVLCFGFVLTVYLMGKHPFLIYPYMDFRVPVFVLLLFFCLKEIRDYYLEGQLFFWQGMVSCLAFTFFLSTLASALIWLYCIIQPEFLSGYVTSSLAYINALPPDVLERIGKKELEENLSALPATTGADLAIDYFGKSFIMSFFISIIISVILRRQPKTT